MVHPALLFSDELIESIQATLPELVLDLFVLVTLVGDEETYVVVLLLYFFAVDREKGIALIAIGLTIAAITPGLKEGFGIDRPPEMLYHRIGAEHYGVPSGHALGSLVIYGALLYAIDRVTNRQAAIGAAVIGLSVGVSRIVLGVHYLADMLAGLAIGIVLLGLFVGYARLDVRRTFIIAALLTLPVVGVFWHLEEIYFGAGGLAGAILGWTVSPRRDTIRVDAWTGWLAVAGGVAVVLAVTILLELTPVHPLPVAVVVGMAAVLYPDCYHELARRVGDASPTGDVSEAE